MESFFSNIEQLVSNFLQHKQGLPLPISIILAFGGGLAASLTPCVLPMIPLYLTYIGVTEITSKADAIKKSSLFCLGSALIFSLMGIFASFAGFVLVEYRGYIHSVIGLFIILMSLVVLEVIKLPLPQVITKIPQSGPFIIGIAFALISSPCASPILFAVIAMAAASGSALGGALIMISYSIGYTGLIFLTGFFAGFLKQLEFFKKHNKIIVNISSVILVVIGIFYLYSGISWFLG